MSTTRSQKRQNNQHESSESVSEGLVSPIIVENTCHLDQDVSVAGLSRPKFPRIENSLLESLKASLKEDITSELKSHLVESQKEMLKLLKPKIGENVRENIEEETEGEVGIFYTPTKSVRIKSTQNGPNLICNIYGTRNSNLKESYQYECYLSQAAACDGNFYQISLEGDNSNPRPGVLSI